MSANVYALLCILLFFCCIYYMYGGMVQSVVRWSKKPITDKFGKSKQPKLTVGESLKCFIPFYQVLYMRKALYHSYGAYSYIAAFSAAFIVIRIVNMLVPIHGNALFVTIWLMYIGILLHVILYAIPTAAIAKMYGYSIPMIIVVALLPHFAAFFLKGGISSRMMTLKKEEVFSSKNGETYIQQKPDQRQSSNAVSARGAARRN